MERVSIEYGTNNIILVAPHSPNDIKTGTIVRKIQRKTGCYSVINNSFQKSQIVDSENDLADCNRMDHLRDPVVNAEFFRPIIRFKKQIIEQFDLCHIFYIHGFGEKVRTNGIQLEIIIGNGDSLKDDASLTCSIERRKVLFKTMKSIELIDSMGSPFGFAFKRPPIIAVAIGGKYGARSSNNLCQNFINERAVQSYQLEIHTNLRSSEYLVDRFVDYFSTVIKSFGNNLNSPPAGEFISEAFVTF